MLGKHNSEESVGQQIAPTLGDGLETNRLVLQGGIISLDLTMCPVTDNFSVSEKKLGQRRQSARICLYAESP